MVLANLWACSSPQIATEFMLPNERFALECRAYYDEIGLVVDEANGEFAHCPYPKRMGETGYYLLHEHHQQQGLLQSRDVGECCFLIGHAKHWLKSCDPIPKNYFELWDIYEEYTTLNAVKGAKKLHEEKDEEGKSVNAVKGGKKAIRKLHEEKDENGKSVNAIKGVRKIHQEKNEEGKSVNAIRMAKKAHEEKDENGKSINAVRAGGANKLKARKKIKLTRISDNAVFIFDSFVDAARSFNLSQGNLSEICCNKRKSTKGFKACYVN